MLRKWMVFGLSAGILIAFAGAGFGLTDDESELEKVMEKVNKANNAIKKGVRTPVAFKKMHKDIAKRSKELVKLAKESKPIKDSVSRAKDVANPQKKWDEMMDDFIAKSETLEGTANKSEPDYDDTKKAFSALSKTCSDCHKVFRVEDEKF